jgi:hypothetical protein
MISPPVVPALAGHAPTPDPGRRRLVGVLVALNAALLCAVLVVVLMPAAQAIGAGQNRPRGQYTLLGGRVAGSPASAMYVVDAVNQELVVLRWSNAAGRLEGIAYRNIGTDAAPAGGGAR